MRAEDFSSISPGDMVSISVLGMQMWAFAPRALPPEWDLPAEIVNRVVAAERAVGELNGLAQQLPNP